MAYLEYLATEIAADHVDGLFTRREALRRLALLGLGTAAAGSLLAACGGSDAKAAPSTTVAATTGSSTATSPAPISSAQTTSSSATSAPTSTVTGSPSTPAQAVTFPGPTGILKGAFAAAVAPRGAVLIIHENRGLTDHFKALPNRFAASGYSALAVDLVSRKGGTDAFTDPAQATAALGAAAQGDLVADLKAGVDELIKRVPGKKLAVVGFCFGGGQVWSLLAAGEARLAAAAPFYGPGPASPDFAGSKAAVLGVYAEKDTRVNGTKDAMDAALTRANLTHEMKVFPGVDHAFFNDTGARYDQAQATAAYAAVLEWFAKYL